VGSDITSGSVTYSGNLTLDVPVALTSAAGGTVNFTGVMADGAGPGGVVKIGAGTAVLSGNNTYSGATVVQTGTLSLLTASNNNIPNSTKIVVGDTAAHNSAVLNVSQVNSAGDGFHVLGGQTLAGHGSVLGRVTVDSGAFLAPGGSVGTLTTSSVTLHGTLNIEIDESNPLVNDVLNVSGNLSLAGAGLNVSLAGAQGHAIYVISHYGSLTGTFATMVGLPSGYSLDTNYLAANQIALVSYIKGDFNRDGLVSGADISAMLTALTDLNVYKTQNHLTNAQLLSIGDLNASLDGVVTNKDIQPELDLVASLGGGSVAPVPEPAGITLLGLAALGLIAMGRRSRNRTARKISLSCR
jgi:autotransporter-associated beta strand protein